jgi:lipopolysaccharide export system permease protein
MHLVTNFETTLIPSSLNPNEILKKLTKLNELNFIGLYQFIKLHERDGLYTSNLNSVKAQFYNKFAYPFACLILAVIGACLGIVGRRRVVSWGYVALGLIVFVFYMSQTIFDSYADSGRIEPAIAVWMPNLILGGIAAITYFYRASK